VRGVPLPSEALRFIESGRSALVCSLVAILVADAPYRQTCPSYRSVRRLISQILPGRVVLPFKFPAQPQKLVDEFLKFFTHGLSVLGALCVVILAIASNPRNREDWCFWPDN
jgi:hypothetical protein